MDFCSNCNNLLFIKEYNEEKKIVKCCPHCDIETDIVNNCVYKKVYKKDGSLFKNHKFLNFDDTLPKINIICPDCQVFNENVYYKNENLDTVITCKKCFFNWNLL